MLHGSVVDLLDEAEWSASHLSAFTNRKSPQGAFDLEAV